MTKKRARKQKRDHNAQHVLSEMAVTNDRLDEFVRALAKIPLKCATRESRRWKKLAISQQPP